MAHTDSHTADDMHDDILHMDDIVEVYDDTLSDEERIALKLAASTSETARHNLEPLLTTALRNLRRASLQEAEDNAYYLKGEMPPRLAGPQH